MPLYDTLAKNAIEYITNHAEVSVALCSKKTLPEILKAKPKCPTLKYIILADYNPPDKEFVKQNRKFTYLFLFFWFFVAWIDIGQI